MTQPQNRPTSLTCNFDQPDQWLQPHKWWGHTLFLDWFSPSLSVLLIVLAGGWLVLMKWQILHYPVLFVSLPAGGDLTNILPTVVELQRYLAVHSECLCQSCLAHDGMRMCSLQVDRDKRCKSFSRCFSDFFLRNSGQTSAGKERPNHQNISLHSHCFQVASWLYVLLQIHFWESAWTLDSLHADWLFIAFAFFSVTLFSRSFFIFLLWYIYN